MLTTNINNKYIENFINNVGPSIVRQYPELNNIAITITDDSNHARTPYVGNETESPFVELCNEMFENVLYNDIVCINNLVQGLEEGAFHALIAHEIGHFVWHYRNMEGSDQEQELFADEVAMSLNFHDLLRKGLEHARKCLSNSRNIFTDIFGSLDEGLQNRLALLDERIRKVV